MSNIRKNIEYFEILEEHFELYGILEQIFF